MGNPIKEDLRRGARTSYFFQSRSVAFAISFAADGANQLFCGLNPANRIKHSLDYDRPSPGTPLHLNPSKRSVSEMAIIDRRALLGGITGHVSSGILDRPPSNVSALTFAASGA